MITIIFAKPGMGKTSLMTHLLNMQAFNKERNLAMQSELFQKIAAGFRKINTIPLHCVSANYSCTFKRFRYTPRHNRVINPYRLGFANKFVKSHFNLPYECIGITEAQKYLNSRMSLYFPDWQSRWYESHRHDNLDIYLDTQRPMLIDINIRELSSFIEVVSLTIHRDKYGTIKGMTWKVRLIEDSQAFDKYMQSGKKDKDCYTETEITAEYNVFECYDSQSCKPKFYAGHFDEDIDYREAIPFEENIESYVKYLENNDDELPQNFYQKRSVS